MERTGDFCLLDCCTTHTILTSKKYFTYLEPSKIQVGTIAGPIKLIEGSGRATFTLPNGTNFTVNDALFAPKSRRNLLSFKDIYRHGYDTESMTENKAKYIFIVKNIPGKKHFLEKLPYLSSGLHYTYINEIESNMVVNENPELLTL